MKPIILARATAMAAALRTAAAPQVPAMKPAQLDLACARAMTLAQRDAVRRSAA